MRFTAVAFAIATQLVVGTALAAGTAGVGGKGDTGGKGGNPVPAPQNTISTDEGGDVPAVESKQRRNISSGASPELTNESRPWGVGIGTEFHRLVRQNDLSGAGAYKNLAVYTAFARWSITKDDRLTLSEYVTQKFIADAGETGLRLGDLSLTYTRHFGLPQEFDLNVSATVTAPTSYYSQKASLITAPGLSLNLTKTIGYVGLGLRASGGTFLVHYREAEGGNPNPHWRLSFSGEIDVQMPFHEPLSVGASFGTGYVWLYNHTNSQAPGAPGNTQPTQDYLFPSQPVTQSYGGEVYARYAFPDVDPGIKMDFTAAYAQGDPALGFTSVLHDGVSHTYFFVRQNSSVYGVFTARY
jgi:hypothetical protein